MASFTPRSAAATAIGSLDPLVREYLKYVLSQQGQQTVVKDGFIPLPGRIVQEELAKLQ